MKNRQHSTSYIEPPMRATLEAPWGTVSKLRSRRRKSAQTEEHGADVRPRRQSFERTSWLLDVGGSRLEVSPFP